MSNEIKDIRFRTSTVVAPETEGRCGQTLFITSTSFEKRCSNVAEKLTQDYRSDVALICSFKGDYDLMPEHEANFNVIHYWLSNKCDNIISFTLKTYDAFSTFPRLSAILEDLSRQYSITQIDFDVTTFTKQYLLVLLKLIEVIFPESSIRILYTPADRYGAKGLKKQLSKHVRGIIAVPGYDQFIDGSDVKSILITFLGFEEERVLSLIDSLSPKICVPVLQSRRNTHFGKRVPFESNKRLLQLLKARFNKIAEYVDGENPGETISFLNEAYAKYIREKNNVLLIAPHGSKMQTIGIYLFCRIVDNPRQIGVVYSIPVKYEKKQYSGEPLEYIVSYSWNTAKQESDCRVLTKVS